MDVEELVLTSTRSFGWARKACDIISGLIVPIAIGLIATFQKELMVISAMLFWGLLLSTFLIGIATTFAFINVRSAPEIYSEYLNEKGKAEYRQLTLDYFILLESQIIAFAALIRYYQRNRINTFDDLKLAIEAVCICFAAERETWFGFAIGEKWNFAVYLWDDNDEMLKPVWREKAYCHPSTGPGREWREREGHVGQAFSNKDVIITEDAQLPAVVGLVAPNDKLEVYDADTYVSYVSQPILRSDETARPFGVLVATSNEVGRFDEANCRVFAHAAIALASILETAYDPPAPADG